MILTLYEAYQKWKKEPLNLNLYLRTKSAFSRGWVQLDFRLDVRNCTKERLGLLLAQSSLIEKEKASVASVMVHILNFAHTLNSEIPAPNFKYEDLLWYCKLNKETLEKRIKVFEEREIAIKEGRIENNIIKEGFDSEKQEEIIEENKSEENKLEEENVKQEENSNKIVNNMEQEKQLSNVSKKIAQIDTRTLEVVKIHDSISKAQKELNISNITRCLKEPTATARGYYWCLAEEIEGFKERLKKAKRAKKRDKAIKKQSKEIKTVVIPPKKEERVKIEDKVETLTPMAKEEINLNKKLLSEFTDEELIEELKRRDTIKGNVKIVKVIEIEL